MLPFNKLKTDTYTLYRLDRSVNPPAYSSEGTIEIAIQAQENVVRAMDSEMMKKFNAFTEYDVDIKRGDKIDGALGKFIVEGVAKHNANIVKHLEITLERITDE